MCRPLFDTNSVIMNGDNVSYVKIIALSLKILTFRKYHWCTYALRRWDLLIAICQEYDVIYNKGVLNLNVYDVSGLEFPSSNVGKTKYS